MDKGWAIVSGVLLIAVFVLFCWVANKKLDLDDKKLTDLTFRDVGNFVGWGFLGALLLIGELFLWLWLNV